MGNSRSKRAAKCAGPAPSLLDTRYSFTGPRGQTHTHTLRGSDTREAHSAGPAPLPRTSHSAVSFQGHVTRTFRTARRRRERVPERVSNTVREHSASSGARSELSGVRDARRAGGRSVPQ